MGVILKILGRLPVRQDCDRWRDASEAHIRSDLQRASNEASGQKTKRKSKCYFAAAPWQRKGRKGKRFPPAEHADLRRFVSDCFRCALHSFDHFACRGPHFRDFLGGQLLARLSQLEVIFAFFLMQILQFPHELKDFASKVRLAQTYPLPQLARQTAAAGAGIDGPLGAGQVCGHSND